MRRSIALCVILAAAAPVAAQPEEARTSQRRARPRGSGLTREQFEIMPRYLNLSAEQTEALHELVRTYEARMREASEAMLDRLVDLKRLADDLRAAEQAGDAARAEAIRRELDELRPASGPTQEFYAALSALLSDAQRARLAELRVILDRGETPDLRLKPRHAARIAEALDLSDEQRESLRRLQDAFRASMRAVSPRDERTRDELTARLIADIRALLTPGQLARFDAQIQERFLTTRPASASR